MEKRRIKLNETIAGNLSTTMLISNPIKKWWKHWGTLAIVSGVHGNETSSVAGHIAFIQEFQNHADIATQTGSIISIPFANPLGLIKNSRKAGISCEHAEDLNRSFFGSNNANSLAEQIAQKIRKRLVAFRPDLVVDLHTMSTRSVPMVIIDRCDNPSLNKKILHYASLAGLATVYDFPTNQYKEICLQNSLSGRMIQKGIPSFTIEVPGGAFAQDGAKEIVRKALWNLAVHMEIIAKENIRYRVQGEGYTPGTWRYCPHDLNVQNPERRFARAHGPKARFAGLFTPYQEANHWVYKGNDIGYIADVAGNILETVIMPTDGYISNIIDASIVSQGDELFELLVPEK